MRGMLSLLGMTYLAALMISHGLAATASEEFIYPVRASREAPQNHKLLQTSMGTPGRGNPFDDQTNRRIVESRQALEELRSRNFRNVR